jgi:putative ABC transport system ATP-binding protein
MTATPALRVTGLRKSFATPAATATVLDGVDLAVGSGEIVALGGRSGSGKTVLLTVVAGWERPDDGRIELLQGDETDVGAGANGAEPAWRDLAVVPQSLGLLDELTVEENILLPRRLDPRRRPGGTTDGLAARLGIDHLASRFPSQISRGEQQRVALARAAAVAPRLLLADEPIAHQNEGFARAVLDVIADLAAAGTACLLATHDDLAFRAAHRTLHLTDGRLHPR